MKKCRKDLFQYYDEVLSDICTDIFNPERRVAFDDIYTNLYLLKQDPNKASEGDDKALKAGGIFSLFDIFGPERTKMNRKKLSDEEFRRLIQQGKAPYRILLAGEAGVGKTTFLAKLANDWRTEKDFKDIELLFRIPLREAEATDCFGDIVQKYLSDAVTYGNRLDEYIKTNQNKVMLLLDGLDEFGGDITGNTRNNVLAQVMSGDKYKECVVVITTRLWRADKITNIEHFQKKFTFIYIEGFGQEHRKEYTDKFFRNDLEKAQTIRQFLDDDVEEGGVFSTIMAPYPVYMAMLCCVWQNDSMREQIVNLQTISQLVNLMGETLKEHYALKFDDSTDENTYKERLKQASLSFKDVGNVAYPHDPNEYPRKLVFDTDTIPGELQPFETACDVGIITRERRLVPLNERRAREDRYKIAYRIYHMLLLDFLAAKFLASVHSFDQNEFDRHLKELISASKDDIDKFEHLWYFTVAQGKDVGRSALNVLRQEVDNIDFIIRVAFECQDKELTAPLMRTLLKNRALRLDEKRSLSAHVFALSTLTSLVSTKFKRLYQHFVLLGDPKNTFGSPTVFLRFFFFFFPPNFVHSISH